MNLIDGIVGALALIAALRGWRRGVLGQVFEFGGGFLGLIAGVALGPQVASAFTNTPGVQGALISLLFVFIMLTVGQTLGYLIGHRFGGYARRYKLGGIDHSLGALFGIAVTLVSFWLVASLLVSGPSRAIAKGLQRSSVLEGVNSVMPEPPNVLAYLRQYLDTSGFPQVFEGFPRPVGPAVDLPPDRLARRAARRAAPSTVRILVPACGGTQLGSGWVVDGDSVVTNAHVVAGGEAVTVQEQGGGELEGRVVLFDDDIDVAVVQVPGLSAPPLSLDPQTYERGQPGATLGYPGNREGRLVTRPAAIQDRFVATGRDIYGRGSVERRVYELRSRVRQGDSGGPFVLPSGNVAGVVFAASSTDGQVGYALTGESVAEQISSGANRSEPVSTNGCTH